MTEEEQAESVETPSVRMETFRRAESLGYKLMRDWYQKVNPEGRVECSAWIENAAQKGAKLRQARIEGMLSGMMMATREDERARFGDGWQEVRVNQEPEACPLKTLQE